jgi:hypothetical protein
LGNGTLGAQVWQPDGWMFQLNTPLSGVYGGALARLHLRTTPGPTVGLRDYQMRLNLYQATVAADLATEAGPVGMAAFISADTDALILSCQDGRSGGIGAHVGILG